MTKQNLNITDVLTNAIKAEFEGHSFYLMAAQATDDSKGKEVFKRLAQDEIQHAEYLRKQYDSWTETGAFDDSLPMTWKDNGPSDSSIFSDSLKGRIQGAHFEMTALSVGAQLEESAMRFYRRNAEATDNPALKRVLFELADWELKHYELLVKEMELLKGDFWSANQFAPF